jgi:mono/diheme cytochrome c family protein
MSVRGVNWTEVVGAAALAFICCASAAAPRAQAGAAPAQSAPPATAGPSEQSVLAGVYTDDQAKRGEVVSNKLCTSCHGPDLSGGEAGPPLVGLEFIGNWTNLTLADFYDRVHSTMPADAPGTMTPQQTSDVTAYVLKLNKYPAGTSELSTAADALKAIKIEGPRQ